MNLNTSGYVISITSDGIVTGNGLNECMLNEIVKIANKYLGIVLEIREDQVMIGITDTNGITQIGIGDLIESVSPNLVVPVGYQFLGRVVNPLGEPLDGLGNISNECFYPVYGDAVPMIYRQSINRSLITGTKIIDAIIPIGKGQRQLFLGDQATGKTNVAIKAMINQVRLGAKGVYVMIGMRSSEIKRIINIFKEFEVLQDIVIVIGDSIFPVLQSIAPQAGCAYGEYFRDYGRDVLIIYDDLTKHAWSLRQLNLLLSRSSGREYYPANIFTNHAQLLERASNVTKEFIYLKSQVKAEYGSLTALPILITNSGDITSYITTNVISITDGQLFFDKSMFAIGQKPAIDTTLSVSRVGKAAQNKLISKLSGKMLLYISQYKELQQFSSLSRQDNENSMGNLSQLNKGTVINILLRQKHDEICSEQELAWLLIMLEYDLLTSLLQEPNFTELNILECYNYIIHKLKASEINTLNVKESIDNNDLNNYLVLIDNFKKSYLHEHKNTPSS